MAKRKRNPKKSAWSKFVVRVQDGWNGAIEWYLDINYRVTSKWMDWQYSAAEWLYWN